MAATVIGFSPERTGGGYIRLKSDKEIIQQVLGADFEDEKVQKMLEASRFGDILADIMNKHKSGEIKYENLPDYIKELISDGVLDIAVFIGAGYEEHITLKKDEIRLIDKMYKIGKENMPKKLLNFITNTSPTTRLKQIFKYLEENYKLKEDKDFFFDPSLARGLDYYTSSVFEMKLNGKPEDLSVGGGGRYDNLIGMFAGKKIPAVGFSFGIDRIIELI